jgi:hypothetical protein
MFIQSALVASAGKSDGPSPSSGYDITNLDTVATNDKGLVNFNTIGQTANNSPSGSYLSHDGTYLFVADRLASRIYRYTLSTAFDVGTATLTGTSPTLSSSTFGNLGDIYFKSDGSLLFLASYNASESQSVAVPTPRITKFTLNTNWDITNLTNEVTTTLTADLYLFGALSTVALTPTGDKLFIGTGSSGYLLHVAQFSLSTDFDIGTTSLGTTTPIKDLGLSNIPDGISVQGLYEDALGNPLAIVPGVSTDVQFHPVNGLKAWFLTSYQEKLYEFNTNTAYSLRHLQSPGGGTPTFDFSSQDTAAYGFVWGDSGTKLYMVGHNTDSLYQYTASTAYSISGLTYANKSIAINTLTGSSFNGHKIRWKPDGTRFYIMEGNQERVYQFNIPAANAWDITYATFTTGDYKAVTPPINFSSYSLDFDPNGNFFIAGGYSSYQLNKWTMTTAWDVTTAGNNSATDRLDFLDVVKCWDYTGQYLYSAQFLDNGSKLLVHISNGGPCVLTLGTAYALNTASWPQPSQNYLAARTVSGQDFKNMGNFAFSESGADAGKKIVTLNTANRRSYTMTFNTAWDITSATSGTSDIDMQGISSTKFITAATGSTNNGLYYYVPDSNNKAVFQFYFSSAWSGTPSTYNTVRPSTGWARPGVSNPERDQSFVFGNNGLYMFTVDNLDGVSRYDLSSAYNISNPTVNTRKTPFSQQDATPWRVRFKPDGRTMYMLGRQYDKIYTYTLSTAWDLNSTITYQSGKDLYIGGTENNPFDMVFSTDGDYIFIIGDQHDTIYRYSLTANWDLSTASLDSGQVLDTLESYGFCIYFSPDGRKVLAGGGFYLTPTQQYLKQWTLSTPWDISSSSATLDLERNDTMLPPRSLHWNDTGDRLFIGSYPYPNIDKQEIWEYNASA